MPAARRAGTLAQSRASPKATAGDPKGAKDLQRLLLGSLELVNHTAQDRKTVPARLATLDMGATEARI